MEELEKIRALHGVRELRSSEEGCSISSLPNGVYGFTYSPGQDQTPVFAHKGYHSFEIHKLEDGSERLLGYVQPSEAALLEVPRPGAEVDIYPEPWEESNRLVSVDLGLASRHTPTREKGNPYRIVLA